MMTELYLKRIISGKINSYGGIYMCNFTAMDCYLFGQATHYDIYKKMGAHLAERKGKKECALTSGRHMRGKYTCLVSLTTGMRPVMR